MSTKNATTLTVGRTRVALTHPDKVLFPKSGITKGELIAYYGRIAPTMLPWLRNRPLTLLRYPDGIDKPSFFQKSASDYYPDWIARATVEKESGSMQMPLATHAADLVYFANLAGIVMHPWLSRIDKPHHPDMLILDLDPPDAGGFEVARRTALVTRKIAESVGLTPYLKTTGSRGLHVVIPITRAADFEAVSTFAGSLARQIARELPSDVTTEFYKEKRKGRLFLDTRRNAYQQTAVAPYSVRALEGAPVATPIFWEELKEKKLRSDRYTIRTVFAKLERDGDPWSDFRRHAKGIGTASKQLARTRES